MDLAPILEQHVDVFSVGRETWRVHLPVEGLREQRGLVVTDPDHR